MTLLSSRKALSVLLVCGSGFVLAVGCGSDDDKKSKRAEEAGAAGADEGGGPSSGGSQSNPGGAPSEPSAGQAGAEPVMSEGGGGAGGAASAGEAGQAGAGGAPAVNDCSVEGTVTSLDVLTEPTYQGCRGGLMKINFSATDSTDTFKCCGASTSDPSFGGALLGISNHDGGGDILVEVPASAAFGTSVLNLVCPSDPSESAVSIEIKNAPAPVVTGISGEQFAPGDVLTITGENLGTVNNILATSRSGNGVFCDIDTQTQTATSVSCSFDSIPPSVDANDVYTLDISEPTCGYALNRPTFVAIQNTH